MDQSHQQDPILSKAYLDGRKDERRRILGLLHLDLMLLDKKSPESFVERATQLIENEPLESDDPPAKW